MADNINIDNQLSGDRIVLAHASGDVNGDYIVDDVFITGVPTPDSAFVTDIAVRVRDGSTGTFNCLHMNEDMGYDPSVFLGDFTGDNVLDILVSIATGGSGGTMYYYIYSDYQNSPLLLFDSQNFNQIFQYQVTYKDDYKVEVVSLANKERYLIDISLKGKDYLDEIYDANGILKENIQGFVNPISGLYPVDFDRDGVYELVIYQKIAGRYNADALGYMQTILKWNGREYQLRDQYLALYGYDIQ